MRSTDDRHCADRLRYSLSSLIRGMTFFPSSAYLISLSFIYVNKMLDLLAYTFGSIGVESESFGLSYSLRSVNDHRFTESTCTTNAIAKIVLTFLFLSSLDVSSRPLDAFAPSQCTQPLSYGKPALLSRLRLQPETVVACSCRATSARSLSFSNIFSE